MGSPTHATRTRLPGHDRTALLIIDMINEFDFEGGADMARRAAACSRVIAPLAESMRRQQRPVIYANDNFGRWRSSFPELIDRCRNACVEGAEILDRLAPGDQDYLVLKPRHSAFFGTPLEILLHRLEVGHLVLCGITTEYCVHFTAVEAYFRDYRLTVVRDGTAAVTAKAHERSLEFMAEVLGAQVVDAAAVGAG